MEGLSQARSNTGESGASSSGPGDAAQIITELVDSSQLQLPDTASLAIEGSSPKEGDSLIAIHASNQSNAGENGESNPATASNFPSATSTNEAHSLQAGKEITTPKKFEFEMHYGSSSTTFWGLLIDMLRDMTTYKHIHSWDDKMFKGPLKSLLKVVHRSWGENRCNLNSLQSHSTIEEVMYVSEAAELPSHTPSSEQEAGELDSHLFFTKVTIFEVQYLCQPMLIQSQASIL